MSPSQNVPKELASGRICPVATHKKVALAYQHGILLIFYYHEIVTFCEDAMLHIPCSDL
jgi:hypothetical protein